MTAFLAAFLIIFFVWDSPARSELYRVREIHYQMGTLLDITLYYPDPEEGRKILRRSVQEVHRLEAVLSNYDPQSSVSRLNRHSGRGRVRTDPELFRLLTIAVDFSVKTSGFFDVTVGPLVHLWTRAGRKGRLPDARALAEATDLVGYGNLRLYQGGEVEILRKGTSVDLGGIGKGYAVDRVVEILRAAGAKRALVNFGGSSIYGLGAPVGHKSWVLQINGTDGRPRGAVRLRDQALSTSGSMGRYWEIDGRRYGHLINPRSGLPVTEPRMAVVLAETATAAEALTKPLVVLGEVDGLSLIKKRFPKTEALVISEDGRPALSKGTASAFFEATNRP